jgi:hypothetical protein
MKRKIPTLAELPVKALCAEVRLMLRAGSRLSSIRLVRRWLLATGRGDCFIRARTLVEDVQAGYHWTV